MVLIKIALGRGEVALMTPRFRDQRHYRLRQLHSAHHQKLHCVIQHRGIRTARIYHRTHFIHLICQRRRGHAFLAQRHLVRIAANGVDLAVVHEQTIGMRALPARIGVCGKARVRHCNGGLVVRVAQIVVEQTQFSDQQHSLIHNGAGGERDNIGILRACLLENTADDIEPAVKRQACFTA